jgi:hypothetical protein
VQGGTRRSVESALTSVAAGVERYASQPHHRAEDLIYEAWEATGLDGKFLLSTSDPDITAEDVALGYKNLLEAEQRGSPISPD